MPFYDVVVIGSGFGGATMSARLAEGGCTVVVLERGRWWDSQASQDRTRYPRDLDDPWIWDLHHPERENGWVDFRHFRDMSVVQGAAVGGGSHIYANISAEAPASAFADGWPAEVTHAELKPHSDRVAKTMDVQPLPEAQWARRTQLMKDAAVAIGAGARFQPLKLAVKFDRQRPDGRPGDPAQSARADNGYGVKQGTCVHVGECDIGCPADAKSTLDRNYLAIGQRHGLEIRPLHLVKSLVPVDGGYEVHFDQLKDGQRLPGVISGRKVVVAAGSLGSTELLLRCRDEHKTLPRISSRLGLGWCSNGDFLTPALYPTRVIEPSNGPTITAAINYLDGSEGPRYWIEDGGFFNLMRRAPARRAQRRQRTLLARVAVERLQKMVAAVDPIAHVMPWFAQGMDSPDGRMGLRKRWILFGAKQLNLDWDVTQSRALIDTIVAKHKQLSHATGGVPLVPPTWQWAHDLITPHPLGGCCMGSNAADGVVDHRGEVFGHPGLFVVDGSIVPRPLGVNPSRTIGALGERAASLF
jgi:cholesterol oxidase